MRRSGGLGIAEEMLKAEAVLQLDCAAEGFGRVRGPEQLVVTHDGVHGTWTFAWEADLGRSGVLPAP